MEKPKGDIDFDAIILELSLEIDELIRRQFRPPTNSVIVGTVPDLVACQAPAPCRNAIAPEDLPGILTDNAKNLIDHAEVLEEALSPVV